MYKVPIIKLIHLTILRLIQTKRNKIWWLFSFIKCIVIFSGYHNLIKLRGLIRITSMGCFK